jgi:hypothetical protein
VKSNLGRVLPADDVLIPNGADKPADQEKSARRSGRAARFGLLNTFADVALAGLTGSEIKVWLIPFRDTKSARVMAGTRQTVIGRRAELSVRGFQKIIARLADWELLRIVCRGRLNAGPPVYRVFPQRQSPTAQDECWFGLKTNHKGANR